MITRYKTKSAKRKVRVRAKLKNISSRLRLSIHRTNKAIYAQIIDDVAGRTLVSVSTLDPDIREQVSGLSKTEQAGLVGKRLAEKALAKGLTRVLFDRGGYKYHGRVKALADASREGGLQF